MSVTHKPKSGAKLTGTEYEAADSHVVAIAHSETTGITATDHHAAPAAGPDANVTIDSAGAAGTASTFARSGHGHQVVTTDAPSGANITIDAAASAAATGAIARAAHGHRLNTYASTPAAIGTGAAGTSTTAPARGDHVHATGAGTPSTQAFGDAAATGTGPAAAMTDHKHAMPADPVTAHVAAADPHTGYVLESLFDAKGDIITASADNTPAKTTVGADDTILMADAAAGGGVKWVASATPSTQAFADAAAVGTGDTFTRGDHKHAMPTLGYGLSGNSAPAVGLSQTSAFATATTSISAATYADVTGASISLAAGTWLIVAQCFGAAVNLAFLMHVAITDGANAIVSEGSSFTPASGTASVNAWGQVSLHAIVAPTGTTTYKLRAARGLTTLTNTWVAQDGSGVNVTNNASDNTDKGTGIFAIRIA